MSLVLQEDRGVIRFLTLNRPESRNALNQNLQEALLNRLELAKTDARVRIIILTGAGTTFCSGLDLAELEAIRERSTEENRRDSERFARLLTSLYSFPKPVIAVLNGHAIAGGAGLASVCDYVLMSDKAKLAYSESRIGFVAALVGVFLLRQVGERQARDLLLSARLISAQEAKEMGLVNQIVAASQLMPEALELAKRLCQNSPNSLAMTKKLLADVSGKDLAEALHDATELNVLARASDDLKEGISAFLEKREPRWSQ